MPDIMTPAQVAECRERVERATEGPWMAGDSNEGCWPAPPQWEVQSDTWANPHHYPDDELLPEMCLQIEWYGGNTEADASFIAHARTDIPALCATVEALREENERLRGLLCEWLAEFPECIYDDGGGCSGSLPDPATWFDLITRSATALEGER